MMTLLGVAIVNSSWEHIQVVSGRAVLGAIGRCIGSLFWRLTASSCAGKCVMGRIGSTFSKNIEPSAEAATPMSVETNIPGLDRPKRKLPISDRCCAPHPPCIDLIDPPGHPLSGRAHFWGQS